MARRMAAVGIEPVFDPRSGDDLDRLAAEIAGVWQDRAGGAPMDVGGARSP
jgi:hypothetical protein